MESVTSKPKVSVIVPIYNVEKYLRRCLDSLVNQTLTDIEIILVDDESPDNSKEIYQEYIAKDDRIKLVQKKNGGLGFARNSGLEIAIGEFIAYIDSDDYVDVNMFKKLYDTSKKNNLDTVYCGYNNLDDELKVHSFSEVDDLTIFSTEDEVNGVLLDMIACKPSSPLERKYRMSVWHAIYSRDLIENNKIRFCSERQFISEDIIYHIDYLSKANKIAFIPDSFYYYCYNEDSLTKTFREDRFEKSVILHQELLRRFKVEGYKESVYKNRVDRFLIGYARYTIVRLSKAAINYSEKLKILKRICKDDVWNSMKDYPVQEMPFKQKLVFYMIKYNMLNSLLFISKNR
ncbi:MULTISPECIES: glycosyltransferase [unclassified Tenacibaculum]|uniref:glycosyltransferase n=1 Tax=unclassified Tenacibaculum TaxID=2635139 RepID=UPI001F30F214|nr:MULTISPECIES: glycosyltransferase [unclassified Tenacibaculum]MCF2876609.1 glycosyltransferase [Tenacibaculum sp. Cn5-1]MCF2936760.1 glycosyltransferase [Tenacibaculum sp. Cn5-34]MCG7512984.1 glycosyltransferase [Tenacibaculum sp. Cn5-46]